ncbi:hypothetical protein Ait01nite_057680 [Actinoplanes italicus]|uniref:Immunity protein Imm1 of predicted polymorphic toxin system n=1 Tax=Actinoplanes italicus TaxID=113567 RepID=A0A2T0K5S7_9ACTN|nr:Imm1 family immunity protein [Actinoplanes italicus]PRX18315.1 immunity protein Imm1 of predicted polymorphic toxin system [Actinoplanes italicus]GIE32723.1 hypothetical protein Ait01nite_057680 [Actinoplanes italicus]
MTPEPGGLDLFDRMLRRQTHWFPGFGAGDRVLLTGDSRLEVHVNTFTGYGGLIWYESHATADSPPCWISDASDPPDFDPMVIANDAPSTFDPRSLLPVTEVRAAVAEFCRTGARPRCVGWVPGNLDGRRDDEATDRFHGDTNEALRLAMVTDPVRLRVLGALRVLRMVPLLPTSDGSPAAAITGICEVRGGGADRPLDGPVRTLQRLDCTEYTLMAAVQVALDLAREDDPDALFRSVDFGTCAFWSVAHQAVLKSGLEPEERAWDLAREMRDAEEAARLMELRALLSGADPRKVFRRVRVQAAAPNTTTLSS